MKLRIAIITLVTVATVGLGASAVGASSIDGVGSYLDDWGNNHTVEQGGMINSGNVVGVWQSVLWADGNFSGSGCTYVDGQFGSATKTATISWQTAHFPSDSSQWDGIVGPNTWGNADNRLATDAGGQLYYSGANHNILFIRDSGTTLYTWQWNGSYRTTSHPTPSLGC